VTEQEKTLISGCVRGDKTTWDEFVQRYSNLVYHTIRQTLTLYHSQPRAELIEDLYQEFFISVLQSNCRKLTQFRGDRGCTLASWLRVVASRLTIDFLRKQTCHTIEMAEHLSSDQPEGHDTLIEQEQETALVTALETLSPSERLMVELHFRLGLPTEEIATILKTSVGAVYTQKSRVLDKIREILGKILPRKI
jgi:RNA polymerase sigma-70 factor (ECF subfamily)